MAALSLLRILCAVGLVGGFRFPALFDEAGISIKCPSGNKVYIHPISGDLQQCSQQLGFYNSSSCPGGTVCERFPVAVPNFQDYCCWAVEDKSDEESDHDGNDELPELPTMGVVSGSIVATVMPLPPVDTNEEEDEDDEWIPMTTTGMPRTKKTRRPPRSRRIRTTTTEAPTTTTTTRAPPPRRGPKCRNQDDAALIDFGNRLRDCYFQQCPYGYRCEMNLEIRRYICCGAERDVFPPPGLPPLPAPKPLVPRPFRPQRPPYYHEDNESLECPIGGEYRPNPSQIAVCSQHDPQLKCPASHPDCVHSKYAGQMVCCRLGGIR